MSSSASTRREGPLALTLFVLTIFSTLYVGAAHEGAHGLSEIWRGYAFALPLMAILAAHEAGHYVAARIHRVDVSLPYFIPVPFMLMGTMGAVIRMRQIVRSRSALLDIGAAGPLCGLVVAIPVLIVGISQSAVSLPPEGALQEGHSLFYEALLWWIKGPMPEGHDILLTPTAFAGWVGLLVTMLNLLPVGQLDGGHVAYALFGPRQDLYSRRIRLSLLFVALAIGLVRFFGAMNDSQPLPWAELLSGANWLVWWLLLTLMARSTGDTHPPTEPGELSPRRRVLAWLTLALFVLLFMPTPLSVPE